jgi:photosystem II stability/assembly factor-like uncharacterized protein
MAAKKKTRKQKTAPAMAAANKRAKKSVARAKAQPRVLLLVGTRKGAFLFRSDAGRSSWKLEGPIHLGAMVHHLALDPRDGGTLLMAARTGHLGPTVFRSTDLGKSWKEAKRPPAFRKPEEGAPSARVVDHTFWLTPGHASQPGVWYAGSSPQGLFRSEDGGVTWDGVLGMNEHPMLTTWTGGEKDGTPDGPKLHSVIVDPRDARHLYVGMSSGGIFESRDEGATWTPLNKGVVALFRPVDAEFGHDPHCVVQHPAALDRLYQQNHCGIYRLDRQPGGDDRWTRIGDHMPAAVGDIGFPMVVHPRDPDTAWVFPMDGTEVWPRTSPGGKPAVYGTRDAGETWQRLDRGLPRAHAYLTVKRQAFAADGNDPVGLYFGTTSGALFASADEGRSWRAIAEHLPHVYSVGAARLG